MADTEMLDVPKQIAPHPRAMLWFSERSRYDAMLHANLPVFVLEGRPAAAARHALAAGHIEARHSPRLCMDGLDSTIRGSGTVTNSGKAFSSTRNVGPVASTTALSMTFCNSRIFPGQVYSRSRIIVSSAT